MQPSGILETALYVTDVKVAAGFYADVLGMEVILRAGNESVFFRCGPGVLILFNVEKLKERPKGGLPIPSHGAIGPGHVCFSATRAEIAGWKSHLEANGIAIESEFDWPNGAHSLYFRDPSGNSIEFAEPQLWNLK
ncbi:VOC family protein [Phyllobacterium zundukense]|uniref:Glyoxalase/bleomycin resistance/extradiol dioxygenase family protein n=1 Tax=Phyllobacterium zundukense TaxID=1867719 RepID=A0A2N9VTE6_9HYPH|nr:VOC family protein [Phyllobacterium zundukense]ATU93284.1 bleomycin resistance protein [Phyllobacterium zundukense]PIO42764.1 glyoxalase/bleomycin resistance/extradiol dioxygenase family protein [Phyllobacterium zundukense]